jgi:hypothetical protein
MVYALSDSLAGLAGAGTSLSQGELLDAKTKGVTVLSYKQDGYTGQKFVLKNVPFSAFKANSKSQSLAIKQVGNKITVSGALDLTNSDGSTNTESDALAQSMLATADVHISIKFPYEISESNGEVSTDKRTVTWRPKFGEKNELRATMTIPSQSQILLIVVGVLVLGIIGGLSFVLRKRKSQKGVGIDEDSEQ